jgi:hypothetical protein
VKAFAILMVMGLFMALTPSYASEIGLQAFEIRGGFADLEEDAGSTWIVSAGLDLGNLTPELGLELNVDFWSKSWGDNDLYDDYDWTWTNIGFLGNVTYGLIKDGSVRPYLFGGLGLHYWKASLDCPSCDDLIFGDLDESGLELGFDAGIGAEFGSGDGVTPVARAGYNTNGGADYLFIEGGVKIPIGD